MIVEDEPLVALGVHAALSSAGASIISAARISEAIDLIGYADVAAAVLDINLGGEDCSAVCQALGRRRVPFMFYTGYSKAAILHEWPDVPVVQKPATGDQIINTLVRLINPR